jgi:hypothetical protein
LPSCIGAGVIRVENGVTYDRDGEVVKRFGFLHLGRHFLATFLMDEQENPAVVQAIMHARWKMDRPSAPRTLAAKQSEPLRKSGFYPDS